MLAIHLSGNLITDETKNKIRDLMRPRKRAKNVYDMINDPDEESQKPVFKVSNIDMSAAIRAKLQQYQQEEFNQRKQQSSSVMKGQAGDNLIFSRVLGHAEIPRSHKWQES